VTPPIDYAQIAARAVQVSQKWAEPHVASLCVRLLMAALIYEALAAACAVHGLVYEETALDDGFSLKMADREVRYTWQRTISRVMRVRKSGSGTLPKFEEHMVPPPPTVDGVGVLAQGEVAESVRLLVAGW
jgi:hypothetical protein